MFTLIDFENWERKEHYLHFYNDVRCSYSTCVNIDISNLNGQRLYPAMLWLLTQTVNEMPEFRTALTEKGLGYFQSGARDVFWDMDSVQIKLYCFSEQLRG